MNTVTNETTTVILYQMVLTNEDNGDRLPYWVFDTEEEAIEYCRGEIERRNSDEFRANLALYPDGVDGVPAKVEISVEEITTTTTTTIATKRIF